MMKPAPSVWRSKTPFAICHTLAECFSKTLPIEVAQPTLKQRGTNLETTFKIQSPKGSFLCKWQTTWWLMISYTSTSISQEASNWLALWIMSSTGVGILIMISMMMHSLNTWKISSLQRWKYLSTKLGNIHLKVKLESKILLVPHLNHLK